MREMKLTLGDGNVYKFRTLTRTQVIAVRAMDRRVEIVAEDKRYKELSKKLNDGEIELTERELNELVELEEKSMNRTLGIIRTSLAYNHKDFTQSDDISKEEAIAKKLNDMMDIRDMNRIVSFALTGTVSKEEEAVKDIELDLTV